MKIKLKIQYDTLKTLCDLYDAVCENYACYPSEIQFQKDFKAAKNVVDLLFVSFKKKLLNKQVNCKPFNVSFEYFQAYFLLNFLSVNATFFHGIYEQNTLLQFLSKLHQQL